MIINCCS